MKTKNSLLIFIVSLLFIASLPGSVNAAQQVTGVKPVTRVAQPLAQPKQLQPASTIMVLKVPIVVNESAVYSMSLYSSLLAAIDRVHKAYSPLKFHDCQGGWPTLEETYYSGYNAYVKKCANKSYSVQDQQNAGCLGNDTVNQCTQKLFRYCLSRYEQEKTSYGAQTGDDLKTKIIKGIEKSNKINSETRELTDALKALQNLMP